MPNKFNSKPLIALVAAVVVVIGIILIPRKQDQSGTAVTEETSGAMAGTTSTAQNSSSVAGTSTSPYQDGTYTTEGSYNSPGGTENVKVTLTLAQGIVTDSNVIAEAQDGTSKRYQDMFIAGYKQYVTGKNIDDITLSKVSGSSLTSMGFNDAVTKIKADASAQVTL